MRDSVYAKAYTEVLEILKYIPRDEYNKISKEKIDFFINNCDKNYSFSIDPEIDLDEQSISEEAKAIIVTLFRDYFATEKQKNKLNNILEANEIESERIKSQQYNSNDIFKKNKSEELSIEKKELLPTTKKLLTVLYIDYKCDADYKLKLEKTLKENEIKLNNYAKTLLT